MAANALPVTTSITTRFLVDLLDAHGDPPDALLARAGVARADLASPDAAIALDAFRELWARAAAVDPAIGLTMLERFPDGQMHVVAHLALRSATVGSALEAVERYAGVTTAVDRFELRRRGAIARFEYACLAPGAVNPWIVEHYLAMAAAFVGRSCGRSLPMRAVELVAPRQAPAAAYRRRFGVDPAFGSAANALVFDAGALAWPLRTHDAYLHAILERVVAARRPRDAESPVDRARRLVATALLRGATPSLADVAAACGLGAAALRGRLAREGTTFRALLDDTRRDLARDHLVRGLSVTETAYLLGFSEPAAFQHACRRWFGCAAGEVRTRPGSGRCA